MSKSGWATIIFGAVMTLAIMLWIATISFVAWQWPIQFWTWDAPARALFVLLTAFYLFLAFAGAAMAAVESLNQ